MAPNDRLVESVVRRISVSFTPLLEVDIRCVGTLRLRSRPISPRVSCLDIDRIDPGPPLVTATHSRDPKDPGVAPELSIAQQRSGVLGRRQRSVKALSTRLEILFGSLRACV